MTSTPRQTFNALTKAGLKAGGKPFAQACGVCTASIALASGAGLLLPAAYAPFFLYPLVILFWLGVLRLATFLFPPQKSRPGRARAGAPSGPTRTIPIERFPS